MARQLSMVFNQALSLAAQKKELERVLNEELASHPQHNKIKSNLEDAQQKMKELKMSIVNKFKSEANKLDDLKCDIASEKQMLTDIALADYINGKNINTKDKDGIEYEPFFSLKYKKKI